MVRVPPKLAPRLPGPRGASGPALRRGSPPAQGIGASLRARWVPWREHWGPVRARARTRTRSHRACLQGRVGGRRRVPGSPALGPAWRVRPARVALERACARLAMRGSAWGGRTRARCFGLPAVPSATPRGLRRISGWVRPYPDMWPQAQRGVLALQAARTQWSPSSPQGSAPCAVTRGSPWLAARWRRRLPLTLGRLGWIWSGGA